MPVSGAAVPAAGWARAAYLARLGATRSRLLVSLARRHWLLALLLTAGLVLRILAEVAYRPVLLYIDSIKYLIGAYPGNDPPGYKFALRPLLTVGNLDSIATIQHALGLAMAVTIYLVLLRRGAPRWPSALAVAPVLLDGYQLQIEQVVMPDVMFEVLIVAGVAALLWSGRPRMWLTVVAGLALGASATARQVGEILILPALLYLAIALPGWRERLRQGTCVIAAFALPILFASFTNYIKLHDFSLAPYASGSIYGRMAEAADCSTLKLPSYERSLCPSAQQKKLGPDGLDHDTGSPIKYFTAPPGMDASKLVSNFDRRVVLQQPLNVLASAGQDAMKLFALHRVTFPGDRPISRWQFQTTYPQYPPYIVVRAGVIQFGAFSTDASATKHLGSSLRFGGGGPVVVKPLARFLRAYQLDGGYTPGPLFIFAALAGLAGSLACLRRRASPAGQAAARACLLLFTTGATVMLASDIFEFSWRYQLPVLITLPPAAAAAITAVLRRSQPSPAPAVEAVAAQDVFPHPLETGEGSTDDGAQRQQHHEGHQHRDGLHHDGAKHSANHDGGQHTDAAGHRVGSAAHRQPGDDTREGAGQIGS
jgi:Dolichyl-phosphate-mannose-protein mannosyltransferase